MTPGQRTSIKLNVICTDLDLFLLYIQSVYHLLVTAYYDSEVGLEIVYNLHRIRLQVQNQKRSSSEKF